MLQGLEAAAMLHLVVLVGVAPAQGPRGEIDCGDGASRRGADQHAVGVAGGDAGQPPQAVVGWLEVMSLFKSADGLRPLDELLALEWVFLRIDHQQAELRFALGQHVEPTRYRQRRPEEERVCLGKLLFARRAAQAPSGACLRS